MPMCWRHAGGEGAGSLMEFSAEQVWANNEGGFLVDAAMAKASGSDPDSVSDPIHPRHGQSHRAWLHS